MTTMTSSDRREKIWAVVRVASGNFLEMYDFFVFGYYATAIGRAFFPTGSEFAQLMLAFMTFGAGFLMRLAAFSSAPTSTITDAAPDLCSRWALWPSEP